MSESRSACKRREPSQNLLAAACAARAGWPCCESAQCYYPTIAAEMIEKWAKYLAWQ
jgi:hypothetical protein